MGRTSLITSNDGVGNADCNPDDERSWDRDVEDEDRIVVLLSSNDQSGWVSVDGRRSQKGRAEFGPGKSGDKPESLCRSSRFPPALRVPTCNVLIKHLFFLCIQPHMHSKHQRPNCPVAPFSVSCTPPASQLEIPFPLSHLSPLKEIYHLLC